MSTNGKRRRKLTPAAKIMITILSVIALACLGLSGYYAYTVFSRDDAAAAYKRSKDRKIKEEAKIQESSAKDCVILGKTADAGREYIDETLFLGDSNTVRFMTFLNTDGTTFTSDQNTIAVVGMGAEGITSVPCEQTSYGTLTMAEAVSYLQPRRIIMTFGTNNLDIYNMDAKLFIENYEPQAEAVERAYPYADLIINSIPPCRKLTHYPIISNEQIKEYNAEILKMCERHEWKYLNSFEALSDPVSGFAKDSYFEDDGIHLNDEGLVALFRYIRTHAWIKDDERPMPLDPLPYIYGPVTEIYTVDPLSNQPFEESVLHPETEYTETPETYIPEETPQSEPEPEEPPVTEEEPADAIELPEVDAGDSENPQP